MLKKCFALTAGLALSGLPAVSNAVPVANSQATLRLSLVDVTSTQPGSGLPSLTFSALEGVGEAHLNGASVRQVTSDSQTVAARDGTTVANGTFGAGAFFDMDFSGSAQSSGDYFLGYNGALPFSISAFTTATFLVEYAGVTSAFGGTSCGATCPRSSMYLAVGVLSEGLSHTGGLTLEIGTDPGYGSSHGLGSFYMTATSGSYGNTTSSILFTVEQAGATGLAYVAAPVPEPETWALMAFGLAALASRTRKR